MKKSIYRMFAGMTIETKALLFCVGMMGIVYLAVTLVEWACWILI